MDRIVPRVVETKFLMKEQIIDTQGNIPLLVILHFFGYFALFWLFLHILLFNVSFYMANGTYCWFSL